MTKKEFMRKFYEAHFDYDDENKVINLGQNIYSHMSEDTKDVMSFLIYSNKSKENVQINYNLRTETICNLSDISGRYQDRDLYIALYSILGFLELLSYEDFKMEHIYKFGWLIDMAMFNPPTMNGGEYNGG